MPLKLDDDRTAFGGAGGSSEDASLAKLFDILNRRRWLILGSTVLFLLLGVLYALHQKPVYTAHAVLAVDIDKNNSLSLQDVGASLPGSIDPQSRLETEVRVLQSESLAQEVIDRLHLQQSPDFQVQLPAGASELARQDALLRLWQQSLAVSIVPKTRLIEVDFTSQNPSLAASAVNTLVSAYVARGYEVRFRMAKEASDWLGGQLAEIKQRAEAAEHNLTEYQKHSGVVLIPGATQAEKSTVLSRVEDLNRAYTSAQVERIDKEARYRNAATMNPDTLATMVSDQGLQALRAQQATLAGQYAEATAKFGEEYPRVKELKSAMAQMDRSIHDESQRDFDRIKSDYMSAQRAEAEVGSQLNQAKTDALQLNESATQLLLLDREASSTRELYESLLRRLNEAGVVAGLQSSNVQILDRARVPSQPSSRGRRTYVAGGLFLGLFLGLCAALVLNGIDGAVLTAADLKEITGLPLLGIIPSIARLRQEGKELALAMQATQNTKSRVSEAFRALRTSVLLSRPGAPPKTILITSTVSGEGKSLTSFNLASTLAQRGARVLLVDGDLRRGTQDEISGIPRDPGLTSVLAGGTKLADAITELPGESPFWLLPTGPHPPHPTELLDSPQMAELLRTCAEQFDFVVIDSSPVLPVSDAVITAGLCDVMILVVRSGVTRRHALLRAGELLRPVAPKILGAVLNDDRESVRGYGSSYYAYYQEES